MAVIENTVDVKRSPEDVFDYLVDLRNELEWNPGVESMEKITDGPIGVGTQYRAKWKQSGKLIVECTGYERPTRWSYRNGGPVTVDLSITLAPTEGGTRLVSRFDARPNGFFRVIFPIFLQMMKRAEKSNMTNARRALESTQPVG